MDTKKKLRTNADLNFVSSYSLEQIIDDVECISSKNIRARTIPVDDNQYLIQMEYQREGRATAWLDGRLQRWAGDMTHIYCYGNFVRTPRSRVSDFDVKLFTFLFVLVFILVSLLGLIVMDVFLPGEFMDFVWVIIPAAYVGFKIYNFFTENPKKGLDGVPNIVFVLDVCGGFVEMSPIHSLPSNAEQKDLGLLLDALVAIIADPVESQRLHSSEKDDPLARQEIEQLSTAHNTNSRWPSTIL